MVRESTVVSAVFFVGLAYLVLYVVVAAIVITVLAVWAMGAGAVWLFRLARSRQHARRLP